MTYKLTPTGKFCAGYAIVILALAAFGIWAIVS